MTNERIKYSYTLVDKSTGKPRIKEDIGIATREDARKEKAEWKRWGVDMKILQSKYEKNVVETKVVR